MVNRNPQSIGPNAFPRFRLPRDVFTLKKDKAELLQKKYPGADVDVLLGNKAASPDTPLPAHSRVIMRTGVGDALHKDALKATAAEEESVGTERGSKDKEVYSSTQALLGARYYEGNQNRCNVARRKTAFHGAPTTIMTSAKKQRWCLKGKSAKVFLEHTELASLANPGKFMYPDW